MSWKSLRKYRNCCRSLDKCAVRCNTDNTEEVLISFPEKFIEKIQHKFQIHANLLHENKSFGSISFLQKIL